MTRRDVRQKDAELVVPIEDRLKKKWHMNKPKGPYEAVTRFIDASEDGLRNG